jgi:hypothetical protein
MSQSGYISAIRSEIRVRHYSYQTEKSYLYWNRYFINYCQIRHGSEITASKIEQFLCFIAEQCNVSANTQIRKYANTQIRKNKHYVPLCLLAVMY